MTYGSSKGIGKPAGSKHSIHDLPSGFMRHAVPPPDRAVGVAAGVLDDHAPRRCVEVDHRCSSS